MSLKTSLSDDRVGHYREFLLPKSSNLTFRERPTSKSFTCGSKPKSNIRSASSTTTYVTRRTFVTFPRKKNTKDKLREPFFFLLTSICSKHINHSSGRTNNNLSSSFQFRLKQNTIIILNLSTNKQTINIQSARISLFHRKLQQHED